MSGVRARGGRDFGARVLSGRQEERPWHQGREGRRVLGHCGDRCKISVSCRERHGNDTVNAPWKLALFLRWRLARGNSSRGEHHLAVCSQTATGARCRPPPWKSPKNPSSGSWQHWEQKHLLGPKLSLGSQKGQRGHTADLQGDHPELRPLPLAAASPRRARAEWRRRETGERDRTSRVLGVWPAGAGSSPSNGGPPRPGCLWEPPAPLGRLQRPPEDLLTPVWHVLHIVP